jgi:hypothetical protein
LPLSQLQPARCADKLAFEVDVAFSVEVEMSTGYVAMDWLLLIKPREKKTAAC